MLLTDTSMRNAKGNGKEQKLSDGEDLYLFIFKQGCNLWNMAYRYDGKQKMLRFGKYPTVSLLEARKRRNDAKVLLAASIDPSEQQQRV